MGTTYRPAIAVFVAVAPAFGGRTPRARYAPADLASQTVTHVVVASPAGHAPCTFPYGMNVRARKLLAGVPLMVTMLPWPGASPSRVPASAGRGGVRCRAAMEV